VPPARGALTRTLLYEGAQLYGDVGMSELGLKIVHYADGWLIVRCQRGQEERLIALLASISAVADERCHLLPVATSGTIRSAKRRIGHTKD